MTKKVADLCVKTGSYESQGKQKNRYLNVGRVLETDNGGKMYLLDRTFSPAGVANPDNRDTIILSVFEAKDDKQEGTHKGLNAQGDIPDTSEVPF